MTSTRIALEVQSRVWFDDEHTARSIGVAIQRLLGAADGAVRIERGTTRLPLHPTTLDLQKAIYNHQTVDGETRTIINEIEKLAKNVQRADDVAAISADEFWADFREKSLNPEADSITGRRVCAVDYRLLAAKVAERLQQTPEEASETLKTVLGGIAAAAAVREFSTATAVRKTRG